jgi:hypothetical protein
VHVDLGYVHGPVSMTPTEIVADIATQFDIAEVDVRLAAVGTVAFLVGLFAFKVKSRWCPEWGARTCDRRPS